MQLTSDQKDALQELLNIGVGRAAGSHQSNAGKTHQASHSKHCVWEIL